LEFALKIVKTTITLLTQGKITLPSILTCNKTNILTTLLDRNKLTNIKIFKKTLNVNENDYSRKNVSAELFIDYFIILLKIIGWSTLFKH